MKSYKYNFFKYRFLSLNTELDSFVGQVLLIVCLPLLWPCLRSSIKSVLTVLSSLKVYGECHVFVPCIICTYIVHFFWGGTTSSIIMYEKDVWVM